MKLLAWDTSSKTGALVAMEWNTERLQLVTELTLNVDSTHSERLLWGIHQTLESARWRLEEVDAFGVGIGPGSFTGLRIGITTARTLAHTFKKPLVGVSSLAALARPVALHFSQPGLDYRTLVIAVTDACKGELFALWGQANLVSQCSAPAEGDFPGLWKRGVEEKVLEPEQLVKAIQKKLSPGEIETRWIAIGEGRQRYQKEWEKLPQSQELVYSLPFADHVQGRYLGQLVWESIQAKQDREALHLHPRYLRASDAELKLKAGLLPKGPSRGLNG